MTSKKTKSKTIQIKTIDENGDVYMIDEIREWEETRNLNGNISPRELLKQYRWKGKAVNREKDGKFYIPSLGKTVSIPDNDDST